MNMSKKTGLILLFVSIAALLGPNGMYLYSAITNPELNQQAFQNPISLAFIIEAMMLLGLFLWYVFKETKSWSKVIIYLTLSFVGSLAFSLPLFLYAHNKNKL